jgi:hypothetical protein
LTEDGHGLFQDRTLPPGWRDPENALWSLEYGVNLIEIRTGYLPNTSLKYYHYSSLLINICVWNSVIVAVKRVL